MQTRQDGCLQPATLRSKARETHLLDLPLPLGGGDVVSPVICFLHTCAADADVVRATEELQASLVDGTQRQRRGRAAGTAQSVPDKSEYS